MIAVIQRVTNASVSIGGHLVNAIDKGLLLLLGIEEADDDSDIEWLTKKVAHLRVFGDAEGKMNLSIREVSGDFLVVSQFTLHASTKKGNRPSYIKAANPDHAIPVYEKFVQKLAEYGRLVRTGEFGADMQVSLTNDGPVTIIIDTKNKQ